MKVGDMEILPIIDGMIVSRLPSTKPLPDAESLAWKEQHQMFRPDGMIESTLGGFLVRTRDRLALVDAGAGQAVPGGYSPPTVDVDNDDDPFVAHFQTMGMSLEAIHGIAEFFSGTQMVSGRLPASLDAVGVRPEDVTDLIFTHLHFDHIGWATAGGAAFFPNAAIHCASADLDYFLPGAAEEETTALVYCTLKVPRAPWPGARPDHDVGIGWYGPTRDRRATRSGPHSRQQRHRPLRRRRSGHASRRHHPLSARVDRR